MRMRKFLRQAKRAGACDRELKYVKRYKTVEAALDDPNADYWAYWARLNLDLPKLVRLAAERKILESTQLSARLVMSPLILSGALEELLIRKACEDPYAAFILRTGGAAWRLPDWARYLAECSMLEDPGLAASMRTLTDPDLDPRTTRRLVEMGVLLPEEDAQPAPD